MSAAATGGVLLLVEDDEAIGRLVKAYLEQQDGWRVVWRRTGEDALNELRGQPVRVVVLDIGLPGIDGYEVAKRIRQDEHGRRMLLLALSGYDAPPDWAQSESGFDHHLVKPVDPDQLARLLGDGV